MPLGTEVGLGPGGIVLHGDPAPHGKRHSSPPHFSAHFAVARSPISATAELLFCNACQVCLRFMFAILGHNNALQTSRQPKCIIIFVRPECPKIILTGQISATGLCSIGLMHDGPRVAHWGYNDPRDTLQHSCHSD